MAIGCIDPSNLLDDGAVFILGDSVEPLSDEVPIHSAGRLSEIQFPHFTTLLGYGIAFLLVALTASLDNALP